MAQYGENLVGRRDPRWIGYVPAVADRTVRIDHEDTSPQDPAQARSTVVEDPVGVAEVPIEIAEEYQVVRQAKLIAPRVMRPGGIDADAVQLDAELAEVCDAFSELGKLVRSTWAKVEDVRQQHNRAALECRRQADRFPSADGELEIGCLVARS